MKVGLLWYDDDPRRDLEAKVIRAAQRYREKFGCWPDTCYVHARAGLPSGEEQARVTCRSEGGRNAVRLLSAPNVLLHHFWLGESALKSDGQPVQAAS
jgi:hypothetical protein